MNTQMELRYQVECQDGVAVVRCAGRMVRGKALDECRWRLERLEHLRVLVLDLSEVEMLDAGGLGTLLLVRHWARWRGIQMRLVNPPRFVLRVLQATKLTSVFEVSSLEEALCILQAPSDQPQYAVA